MQPLLWRVSCFGIAASGDAQVPACALVLNQRIVELFGRRTQFSARGIDKIKAIIIATFQNCDSDEAAIAECTKVHHAILAAARRGSVGAPPLPRPKDETQTNNINASVGDNQNQYVCLVLVVSPPRAVGLGPSPVHCSCASRTSGNSVVALAGSPPLFCAKCLPGVTPLHLSIPTKLHRR